MKQGIKQSLRLVLCLMVFTILFQSKSYSQLVYIEDLVLQQGDSLARSAVTSQDSILEEYTTPITSSVIDTYGDGKQVVVARIAPWAEFGDTYPDHYGLLIFNKEKEIIREIIDDQECYFEFIFGKVIGEDLLLISKQRKVHLLKNFETEPIDYCNSVIFNLAIDNFSSSSIHDVIEKDDYLTVTVSGKNENDISGTLQFIIKLSTQEHVNTFFTPNPKYNDRQYIVMTGFRQLASNNIAVSYNSYEDNLSTSIVQIMDRERNVLMTHEFEEWFLIWDLGLTKDNKLILMGESNGDAHMKLMFENGFMPWEYIAKNEDYNTGYYRSYVNDQNEIYLIGRSDKIEDVIISPRVTITHFDISGENITTLDMGRFSYTYFFSDAKLLKDGGLLLLSNYVHTGDYYSYIHNINIEQLSSTKESIQRLSDSRIYPNPHSEFINIEWPDYFNDAKSTYELYNLAGERMLSGQKKVALIPTASLLANIF